MPVVKITSHIAVCNFCTATIQAGGTASNSVQALEYFFATGWTVLEAENITACPLCTIAHKTTLDVAIAANFPAPL